MFLRVETAGIYQMPLADYVNDPAPEPSLNAGTASTLLTQSPLHAWVQHPRLNASGLNKATREMDMGTITHSLLLENDKSRVVIVRADDWRTKAAKEERDAARAVGKLPILEKDYETVLLMVAAGESAIRESEFADDWRDGVSEQTMIFEDAGIWWRSRPDRKSKRVKFDLKTCENAEPNAFLKTILSYGYDLQAGICNRGSFVLEQDFESIFVFVALERTPPYAASFLTLDNQWQAWVDKKLDHAARVWKQCLATNQWTAYPQRLCYLQPPSYAMTAWEEQHA